VDRLIADGQSIPHAQSQASWSAAAAAAAAACTGLFEQVRRQGAAVSDRAQCRSRAMTTGSSCSVPEVSERVHSYCASCEAHSATRTCRPSKTHIGRSSAVINRSVLCSLPSNWHWRVGSHVLGACRCACSERSS